MHGKTSDQSNGMICSAYDPYPGVLIIMELIFVVCNSNQLSAIEPSE